MAIWNAAFLHNFLDGNPHNVHAAPGRLDVVPPVAVTDTPPADQRGFLMTPGQTMTYRFEQAFAEVIGVDLRVDLLSRSSRACRKPQLPEGDRRDPALRVPLGRQHLYRRQSRTPGRTRISGKWGGHSGDHDKSSPWKNRTSRFLRAFLDHGQFDEPILG
jgi:hypothetical protein